MYLILVAIIIAAVMSYVLFKYSFGEYGIENVGAWLLGLIFGVLSAGSAIVYAFTVWSYIAADYKAEIINREYGTNYTQEEVFYASDVIDTIRNLDRKRYEFNGDIMRDNHEK